MNYFMTRRKKWIAGLDNDKNEKPFEKDLKALNEDQENIGKDMWNAIKEFEKEKEKEIEDENGEER